MSENEHNLTSIGCDLCDRDGPGRSGRGRCVECAEKGNMVGDIVWRRIASETRGLASEHRAIYMINGLSAKFVEGIADKFLELRESQDHRYLLKIHPLATRDLRDLPSEVLSTKPPTYWRNRKDESVIVFAPSEDDKALAGSSLETVKSIDENEVTSQTNDWSNLIECPNFERLYLTRVLFGLDESKICTSLEMWVNFIMEIKKQESSRAIEKRIHEATHALRIPKYGIDRLPSLKKFTSEKVRSSMFAVAFRDARKVAGNYARLVKPNKNQDQVDVSSVQKEVEKIRNERDTRAKKELKYIENLLSSASKMQPNMWLESQQEFCKHVRWKPTGKRVFAGGRQVAADLGSDTLDFIETHYSSAITNEDRRTLEDMSRNKSRTPKREEINFYMRWQSKLCDPISKDLDRRWQARINRVVVSGSDLMSVLLDGARELIRVCEKKMLLETSDPKIVIREKYDMKPSYWSERDIETLNLFRFEVSALKEMTKNCIVWKLDSCYKKYNLKRSDSAAKRKVEFDIYLVDYDDKVHNDNMIENTSFLSHVRVIWQQMGRKKRSPISYAFPNDIQALAKAASSKSSVFRRLVFTPRMDTDVRTASGVSLDQVSSFDDVFGKEAGRMFHTSEEVNDDILGDVRRHLETLKIEGFDSKSIDDVNTAIDTFENLYRDTVMSIDKNPGKAFLDSTIDHQARAFGSLCELCRRHIVGSKNAARKIRSLLGEVGVIRANENADLVILAGWHPLRLAEKRAKMINFVNFLNSTIRLYFSNNVDVDITFDRQKNILQNWYFPEAVVIDEVTMVSVEDVSGYALMAPLGSESESQEHLERLAPVAADHFVDCLDQYLEVFPHKASGLSVAMYDLNSKYLPQIVARLIAKKARNNPDMRCKLILSHVSQETLFEVYKQQNDYFTVKHDDELDSCLSNGLEILTQSKGEILQDSEFEPRIDLTFLLNTFTQYAKEGWDCETGSSSSLKADIEVMDRTGGRQKIDEFDSDEAVVYLSSEVPPRSVAEYYDLLYTIAAKSGTLPEDKHAVLVRRVRIDDSKVQSVIGDSHKFSSWVISFDTIFNKSLLQKSGVKIVRDFTLPSFGGNLTVSTLKEDERLVKDVRDNMREVCDIDTDQAQRVTEKVLTNIRDISGKKLLSAARFSSASQEIVGLYLMRIVVESSLPNNLKCPLWLSLDDYGSWFIPAGGKIADALAVSIVDHDHRFEVFLHVSEAKFVSENSQSHAISEAEEQVRSTVEKITEIFIDNDNFRSRSAWCSQFASLLIGQFKLSTVIKSEKRRLDFVDSLKAGEVDFKVCGEAVVSLHDGHSAEDYREVTGKNPCTRVHVLSAPMVCSILCSDEGEVLSICKNIAHASCYPSFTANRENTHSDDKQENDNRVCNSDMSDCEEDSEVKNYKGTRVSTPGSKASVLDDTSDTVDNHVLEVLLDMKKRETDPNADEELENWADATCADIQAALDDFDMYAEFMDEKYRITPNGILVSFRGHPTLTVAKIERKTSELLTTYGIEVVYVQPGRGMISLFVRRDHRVPVPLASALLGVSWTDRNVGDIISFVIGIREDEGSPVFLNLSGEYGGYIEHGPHTLIAGETGSGKGILVQNLLLQLVMLNDPKNVQITVIDAKKGVDFVWLSGFPHMSEDVVTELGQAKRVFLRLVQEMDARYDLFRKEGVSDIVRYNSKVAVKERLPRIFLVHDELGSWMAQEKDYREVVLSSVSNLGMKARAAGIHLVLITQRADADAVPTRLRDNMSNRLCLKVQNSTGSKMVLNMGGAERLLGKGHLACQLANQPMPAGQEFFVVQVPYADPDDMERLAEAAKSHWGG